MLLFTIEIYSLKFSIQINLLSSYNLDAEGKYSYKLGLKMNA